MIETMLFDLDGTLLDRDASVVMFAQQQHRRYEELHAISRGDYVRSFVEIDDNGYVWKDQVYQQLIARYDLCGVTWERLLQDYVDSFAAACVGFAGLKEMLEALTCRGYSLGIITNGRSPFQEGNIWALGIESFFSVILVSGAVGVKKPDVRIFEQALKALNARPETSVFIGDSPLADIKGAQQAGMKAIWKVSPRWERCDYADATCENLLELPDIIDAL
ncbi:MAG: HAD family hydrolase [Cyanobacteria bacterium J06627_28]